MYSKEDLNVKKYGDLLKILKKLGIKRGRQKTEKVIELILKTQKTPEEKLPAQKSPIHEVPKPSKKDYVSLNITNEDLEASLLKGLCSESDSILKTPTPERTTCRRRITRSTRSNAVEVETEKTLLDNAQAAEFTSEPDSSNVSLNQTTTLSRSNTFVLEDGDQSNSPPPSKEVKTSLERSATFTLESNDKQRSPKESEEVEDEKKINLMCEEIQTAQDIESIEKGSEANSGSPSSSSPSTSPSSSPSRGRKTMRRSLRGQLLESKMSFAQRTFLLTSPLRNNSLLPPHAEEETNGGGEKSAKEQQSPSVGNTCAISKTGEMSTTKQNKEKVATQIPRFVNFARAIKIPDFAKIHQKAFSKMEALDEYVERKHTRTNSAKEALPASATKNKENKTPQPCKANVTKGSKPAFGVKLRLGVPTAVVTPKRKLSQSAVSSPLLSSSLKVARKSTPDLGRDRKTPPAFNKVSVLPKLVKENGSGKMWAVSSWNKNPTAPNTPGSHQRRNSYVPTNLSSSKVPVAFRPPSVKHADLLVRSMAKRRSGDLPKVDKRKETFKQMAKREPKIKTRAEIRSSNKDFIKGVRMNRRFELQMAKRGIQI